MHNTTPLTWLSLMALGACLHNDDVGTRQSYIIFDPTDLIRFEEDIPDIESEPSTETTPEPTDSSTTTDTEAAVSDCSAEPRIPSLTIRPRSPGAGQLVDIDVDYAMTVPDGCSEHLRPYRLSYALYGETSGGVVCPSGDSTTTTQRFSDALGGTVTVLDGEGAATASGSAPFFAQEVDLYGTRDGGTVRLRPGIHWPEQFAPITVSVRLYYSAPNVTANADSVCGNGVGFVANFASSGAELTYCEGSDCMTEVSRTVEPADVPGNARYHRIRSALLRTHLHTTGRELPKVALKQFDSLGPQTDRPELLWNSRALEDDVGTPVFYVPWLSAASDETGEVRDGAIHHAGENPILRTGLAMATFAMEYLDSGNMSSLKAARRAFRFIEASEWNNSGFFLRSRWPGSVDDETHRPYLHASGDEYMGMVLGLYYLKQALIQAGDTTRLARLQSLTTRLGNRLTQDHYLILPPLDLPQELHRGWEATYAFAWHLRSAIAEITDRPAGVFTPSGGISAIAGRMCAAAALNRGEDAALLGLCAAADFLGNGLFQEPDLETRGVLVHQLAAAALTGLRIDLGDLGTLELAKNQNYYNVPMAFHAALVTQHEVCIVGSVVCDIQRSHSRLSRAILGGELVTIEIKVGDLLAMFRTNHGLFTRSLETFLSPEQLLIDLILDISSPTLRAPVGTPEDDNYYVAAVARVLGLSGAGRIDAVIDGIEERFTAGSPLSERGDENPIDNLAHTGAGEAGGTLGKGFVWESPPGHRVARAASYKKSGLSDTVVKAMHTANIDSVWESSGLGYLLPRRLLHHHGHRALAPGSLGHGPQARGVPGTAADAVALAGEQLGLNPSLEDIWNGAGLHFSWNQFSDAIEDDAPNRARVLGTFSTQETTLGLGVNREHPAHPGVPLRIGTGRQSGFPPQARLTQGDTVQPIYAADDRDYFRYENSTGADLRVHVTFQPVLGEGIGAVAKAQYTLVVDGTRVQATVGSDGVHSAELSVPGEAVHRLMVSGTNPATFVVELDDGQASDESATDVTSDPEPQPEPEPELAPEPELEPTKSGMCTSSSQCGSDRPFCIMGQCTTDPGYCKSDLMCGADAVCWNNQCVLY